MSDKKIRELLRRYIEESELNQEVAEKILRKILKILFGDKDKDGG